MLILTRGIQEKIVIGDDIQICIVSIDNKKVSIGITAPKNIPIHRFETLEKIQKMINKMKLYYQKKVSNDTLGDRGIVNE